MTLALTGNRGICLNTGPYGPSGWHKVCPYTGGIA